MTEMSSQPAGRLSVPRLRLTPRRALTQAELASLRRIAATLIPPGKDRLSGSEIADFDSLVSKALGIADPRFDRITAVLADFQAVADDALWDALRQMNQAYPDDFYWLSSIIVAAYLYSPEMKAELGYPAPHPNPADLFEVAEELESGILDPVIARGSIYVRTDG